MPLINKTVLQGIADRAAWQAGRIVNAFSGINPTGGGLYFTRVTNTDDPDVEIPTIQPYEQADQTMTYYYYAIKNTGLAPVIIGMISHFNRMYQAGGWDGYLQTQNLRVSDYFNQAYRSVEGSFLLANNVFSETDDTFGTATVAAGPTLVFTDGTDYGDGAWTNPANGTYFAPTRLRAIVVGGDIGAANLDLRLSVKDTNNLPTTIDVTIPSGSTVGTSIDIGTATNRFLDVFNIIFKPAGSTGSVGDNVEIHNKKERTVAP